MTIDCDDDDDDNNNKAILDIRCYPLVSHFKYTPCWRRLRLADYGQTYSYPQNRKYITYCVVVRE